MEGQCNISSSIYLIVPKIFFPIIFDGDKMPPASFVAIDWPSIIRNLLSAESVLTTKECVNHYRAL